MADQGSSWLSGATAIVGNFLSFFSMEDFFYRRYVFQSLLEDFSGQFFSSFLVLIFDENDGKLPKSTIWRAKNNPKYEFISQKLDFYAFLQWSL